MIERTEGSESGIVSFRLPGVDSNQLQARLKQRRVLAAPRQGYVRFSPHFYLTGEDMDAVLEQVRDSVKTI
jgi:selenocysteine lyase/cysteine desulfurase